MTQLLATILSLALFQVVGPGPTEPVRFTHHVYLPAIGANAEQPASIGLRVLNCAPGQGATVVWEVNGPGLFGAAWQFRYVDTDRVLYAHRRYIATSAGTLIEYKAPISDNLYLRSLFWAFAPSSAFLARAYCGLPREPLSRGMN